MTALVSRLNNKCWQCILQSAFYNYPPRLAHVQPPPPHAVIFLEDPDKLPDQAQECWKQFSAHQNAKQMLGSGTVHQHVQKQPVRHRKSPALWNNETITACGNLVPSGHVCHGKCTSYFDKMLTTNPISMITAEYLHAQLFAEEVPWVHYHCKTHCVFTNAVCIDDPSLKCNFKC